VNQRKAALVNASTARTNLALAQALMFASHAILSGSQGGCDDVIDAVLGDRTLKATSTRGWLRKEAMQKLPSLPTFVIAHQQRPIVALEHDPKGAWITSLAGSGDRVWASSATQQLYAQLPSHTPQGSLAFSRTASGLGSLGDEVWVIAMSDWSRKHQPRFNSAAVIKSLAFGQDGFAVAAYGQESYLSSRQPTDPSPHHPGLSGVRGFSGRLRSVRSGLVVSGRYAFKAQADQTCRDLRANERCVDSAFLEGGRCLEVGRARARDRAVEASATSPGGVELE
jgi:hypothetical protein